MGVDIEHEEPVAGGTERRQVQPSAGALVDEEDSLLLEVQRLGLDHEEPPAVLEGAGSIWDHGATHSADLLGCHIEQEPLVRIALHGEQGHGELHLFRTVALAHVIKFRHGSAWLAHGYLVGTKSRDWHVRIESGL